LLSEDTDEVQLTESSNFSTAMSIKNTKDFRIDRFLIRCWVVTSGVTVTAIAAVAVTVTVTLPLPPPLLVLRQWQVGHCDVRIFHRLPPPLLVDDAPPAHDVGPRRV
jgi:hypothetical protein